MNITKTSIAHTHDLKLQVRGADLAIAAETAAKPSSFDYWAALSWLVIAVALKVVMTDSDTNTFITGVVSSVAGIIFAKRLQKGWAHRSRLNALKRMRVNLIKQLEGRSPQA